jgi:hypothetical protein
MGNQISKQQTTITSEFSHALVLLKPGVSNPIANLGDIIIIKTCNQDDYAICRVIHEFDMEDEILPGNLSSVSISPESRREITPMNACTILQGFYIHINQGYNVSKMQLMRFCMTKLLESTQLDRFLRHLMVSCLQTPQIISIVFPKSSIGSDTNADIRLLCQYYQFCENHGIRTCVPFQEWYKLSEPSFQKLHIEGLFGQISTMYDSYVLYNGKFILNRQNDVSQSSILIKRGTINAKVERIPVINGYSYPQGSVVLIKKTSWNSGPAQNQHTPAIGIVSGIYTPSGKRGGEEKIIVKFVGTKIRQITVSQTDLVLILKPSEFSQSTADLLGDQWDDEKTRPSSELDDPTCHRRFYEFGQAFRIPMVTEDIPITPAIIIQLLRMENPFAEPFFIRDECGQPCRLFREFIANILREFKIRRNESQLVDQVFIECIICGCSTTDITKRYDCDHDVCSICLAKTLPNYTARLGSKILPVECCCPVCPAVRKITNGVHDEAACGYFRVHGKNGHPTIKSPGFCEHCIDIIDKSPGACVDPDDPNPPVVRYCVTHAPAVISHYRTCPGSNLSDSSGICGVMHLKNGGCDHITCERPGCGTHYCMRCGFYAMSPDSIYHHMKYNCYYVDAQGNRILGIGYNRM